MADRCLVLLSGGIDSLVCAEELRQAGQLAGCVFVDYAHPAQVAEGWKAFAYCGTREVPLKTVHAFGLDLGDMTAQHAARVVPSRNALLLSLAANVAPSMGADALVIGCNQADDRDYADCRRGFLDAVQLALGMPVLSPLIGLDKAQIIAKARALGLTQGDAWSCYTGGPKACGECPSCLEADQAWQR